MHQFADAGVPFVAIALRDREVSVVMVTQITTMAEVSHTPAWAVIHGRRRNKMTPKMF